MAGGEACTFTMDGRDDVLETVARINGKLVAGEGGDAEGVLESLRQLQAVPMTFAALEATKIGRAVNALRKSAPSEQARELAATLYRGWKALALEHLRCTLRSRAPDVSAADEPKSAPASSKKPVKSLSPNTAKAEKSVRSSSLPVKAKKKPAAAPASSSVCMKSKEKQGSNAPSETEQRPVAARQRAVPQHTAAPPKTAPASSKPTSSSKETSPQPATTSRDTPIKAANNKRVSPPNVAPAASKAQPPKPSCSLSAGKRKEAPTSTDEASLERAKKRLHERYQEAAAVKEKRRIQVINKPVRTTAPTVVYRRRQVRCTVAASAP